MKRDSPLREALCGGGIFAVSTVLPDKIQHLTLHRVQTNRSGLDALTEHSLQLIGCFVLLSVLIWLTERSQIQRNPLMPYPPQTKPTVLAHIVGLVSGAALMLSAH